MCGNAYDSFSPLEAICVVQVNRYYGVNFEDSNCGMKFIIKCPQTI